MKLHGYKIHAVWVHVLIQLGHSSLSSEPMVGDQYWLANNCTYYARLSLELDENVIGHKNFKIWTGSAISALWDCKVWQSALLTIKSG